MHKLLNTAVSFLFKKLGKYGTEILTHGPE